MPIFDYFKVSVSCSLRVFMILVPLFSVSKLTELQSMYHDHISLWIHVCVFLAFGHAYLTKQIVQLFENE